MDPLTIGSIAAQGLGTLGSLFGAADARREEARRRAILDKKIQELQGETKKRGDLRKGAAGQIERDARMQRDAASGQVGANMRNTLGVTAANLGQGSGAGARASNMANAALGASNVANQQNIANQSQFNKGLLSSIDKYTQGQGDYIQSAQIGADYAAQDVSNAARRQEKNYDAFARGLGDLGSGLLQRDAYKKAAANMMGQQGSSSDSSISSLLGRLKKPGKFTPPNSISDPFTNDPAYDNEPWIGMAEGGEIPTPDGGKADRLMGDVIPAHVDGDEPGSIALEPGEKILSHADEAYITEGVDLDSRDIAQDQLMEMGKRVLEVLRKYKREGDMEDERMASIGADESLNEEMSGEMENEEPELADNDEQMQMSSADWNTNTEVPRQPVSQGAGTFDINALKSMLGNIPVVKVEQRTVAAGTGNIPPNKLPSVAGKIF